MNGPDNGPTPEPDPAPRPGLPPEEIARLRAVKRRPPTAEEVAFGARLRRAREEIGMGRNEAAAKLGMAPVRVHEYETGQVVPPALRLIEIVRVLGLDPATIVPEWFAGLVKAPKKRKPRKQRE